MTQRDQTVRFSKMIAFFLPLGFSAALVSVSHVIINSTLARATIDPKLVITSYAIAMSIFGLTEEAAILMRQTCSRLVRDRRTFRSVLIVAFLLAVFTLLFSSIILFTPVGTWVFGTLFGADSNLQKEIASTYSVLVFVTIFSIIRCVFQGVIISQLRTKWLTVGMLVRLSVMYGLSVLFILYPDRITSRTGALIFLSGMFVEAAVAYWEGHRLAKRLPDLSEESESRDVRGVFRFYRPLLFYAFIAVSITPMINSLLGKAANMELAVASYAIAFSITWVAISFHTYMHQMVLNFYRKSPRLVIRFGLVFGLAPGVSLAIMGFTPLGSWILQNLIGIHGELLVAVKQALRIFILYSLLFPWVDFCNGIIMLRDQTKIMVWSQSTNFILTFMMLIAGVWLVPVWNGSIGALAQSVGVAAELGVLFVCVRMLRNTEGRLRDSVEKGRTQEISAEF